LFVDGAIIFDQLTSRRIDYIAPSGRSVTVEFPSMPHFGLWSRPGAGFICIEPRQGYAAPINFAGELSTKEGMISLAPRFNRKIFDAVASQGLKSPHGSL
jgi:hypothetical protein